MAEHRRPRRNAPTADADTGRSRRRLGGPKTAVRRRGRETSTTDQPARSTAVAVEVRIPELGESVTEGTITAWLVKVGERVEADQPLFELSSDKIDTEVPAPVRGILQEIKVQIDETVDVGTVVAIISEPDEEAAEPRAAASPEPETQTEPAAQTAASPQTERPEKPDGDDESAGVPMSPLVRRQLREHDLDVAQISGSGLGGRITREDVEATLKAPPESPPSASEPSTESRPGPQAIQRSTLTEDERTRVEDLSRIRQRIAAKMMESLQSSAQLTTVQEADATGIMRLRDRIKDDFRAREGVSLSPFVFLCRATVLAIRNHPKVNALADFESGKVTYHDYVNLGIGVDTDKGLIVPNVKGADDLSLAGLARAIVVAADKARGRAQDGSRLEISDLRGGTFTITNTGSRGVLIDTPILNYPEVAILATGKIQKRPVVVEDLTTGPAIAVRDMAYLCLTYDHRLIDGADAARFVTAVKEVVETHDWTAEIGY
ncbi:MAG: 2-oxoglutarate dehydrogenase, E2 component, dihydrolipoamide succinyltransferase [Egibacteraceae bacterium]